MTVNPKIFKAYDIRGIYPEEINKETAHKIGQAFVKFLKKKKLNIVVGQDRRLSSPVLFKGLVGGITNQGANVIDIGLSTSPMLYWACAYYGFDGGINITASHNPKEYNGFKVVREKAIPISEKSGLLKIKNLSRLNLIKSKFRGRVIKKNIIQDYIRFNIEEVDISKIKPLKIIVDTANAVPGIIIPEIFKRIPVEVYHLFPKLDGRFPNHQPDPLVKENLKFLQKEILKRKTNLGVAFDGDGDRIFFVDEKGEIISGDTITAMVAAIMLRENPNKKILYDIRSSRSVEETIKTNGGVPVVYRVGHSFIKEKMRKDGIIFAGEFSGHYYHQNHYFCEAPFFVLLKILEEMSRSQKKMSELIRPYQIYHHSGEINFRVKNKGRILEKLEKKFSTGKLSKIDGLRIDFLDWWFNVRPSHTEPVLRLVVEAKTKKLMKAKQKELAALIKN